MHCKRSVLLFSPRVLSTALLSLVVTDVLAFRAHVLPRNNTSNRVVHACKKKEKKKNRKPVPARRVYSAAYRRATWRRSARTSSLSLCLSFRELSTFQTSGSSERSAFARPACSLSTPLLLSRFLPRLDLVLIRITHREISRTTSGSRSSRSYVARA